MIVNNINLLITASIAAFIQVLTGSYLIAGIIGIIILLSMERGFPKFKKPSFYLNFKKIL